MALIQWKQIDSYISGSKELTGSLFISGTVSADEFIGIDPTSIFTGSISASVFPEGNVFVVSSGSENLVAIDANGNMVVEGSITAQEFYTEIVSASIIFESGSSQFGNTLDDTHKFTGSLLVLYMYKQVILVLLLSFQIIQQWVTQVLIPGKII